MESSSLGVLPGFCSGGALGGGADLQGAEGAVAEFPPAAVGAILARRVAELPGGAPLAQAGRARAGARAAAAAEGAAAGAKALK